MKNQFQVCKKIRCKHIKEGVCSFHDCVFSAAEIITKETDADNAKFTVKIIVFAGAIAVIYLVGLYLISRVMKWLERDLDNQKKQI